MRRFARNRRGTRQKKSAFKYQQIAFRRPIPTSSAGENIMHHDAVYAAAKISAITCIPREVLPNWLTSLLLALTENIQFLHGAVIQRRFHKR
jgi:hypothetical protein